MFLFCLGLVAGVFISFLVLWICFFIDDYRTQTARERHAARKRFKNEIKGEVIREVLKNLTVQAVREES